MRAQSLSKYLYKIFLPVKVHTSRWRTRTQHHLSQTPCYLLLLLLLLVGWCLVAFLLFRCCQLLRVFCFLSFIVAIPEVTLRGKWVTGGSSHPVPAAFPPSSSLRHCFRSTVPCSARSIAAQAREKLKIWSFSFNSL